MALIKYQSTKLLHVRAVVPEQCAVVHQCAVGLHCGTTIHYYCNIQKVVNKLLILYE